MRRAAVNKLEEFGDGIWAEFNINYSYIIHTIYTITQNIKKCNVWIFEPSLTAHPWRFARLT